MPKDISSSTEQVLQALFSGKHAKAKDYAGKHVMVVGSKAGFRYWGL